MNWFKKIKKLGKRDFLFLWQRLTRGWDDSETWSMDQSLAKIILPRLHTFRDIKNSHPHSLSMDAWNKHLDEMIWGFHWFADGKQYSYNEKAARAHDAIELFGKYYKYLWMSAPNVWGGTFTISTNQQLAELILPYLKRFQELRIGYPANMTDEQWESIISEMIWGFEWFANCNRMNFVSKVSSNDYIRAQDAIQLFARYYPQLWW